MSYQVIARKYRPQRFDDVVGQEHVSRTLSSAIAKKRIAHAYLFCGPRGTGKTTIARIFAKCLNCTDGPKVDFAETDPRCLEIAEGRALDVLEIDGASNNGVEQVRELRETCRYAPASSRYKIYIIDEVHMLSTAAFNALLKTLEEPPEHVKFMFATTDPEKVLPTILSRCQRFDLRRIPTALIAKHLARIADLEHVTIDPAALHAIARGAEGAMRDAESTLDQLISFCGNRIEESDVLSMFGLTAHGQLMELSRSILAGEIEHGLRQLNELANNGKDLGRLLSDLLHHFRNLLIFQVSRGDLTMLEVSEAEAAMLKEQSKMAGTDGLTRILEVLTDAETRLREVASKKILAEVTLLKAVEARSALSIDSVLKRLQDLRNGALIRDEAPEQTSSARLRPSLPAETPLTVAQPKPAPSREALPPGARVASSRAANPASASSLPQPTAPAAAPASSDDLPELWSKLLEAIGRASQFTRSYLLEAHPVSFQKNLFTIGFDPEFEDHIGLVDNARNHALLQTKFSELGYPSIQFKFIKSESPATRPATPTKTVLASTPAPQPTPPPSASPPPTKEKLAAVPFSKDDFKNDPLIQKALEIFKGHIVEVRA
jgi:DNA polymerase III subunit gamma/tau